jgi:UDP-glucuronate 4-epimerase
VLTEEDVVEKPVSPYAATKKACELIAYTYHHLYGLNTTGLRFFTVYGPRGRPDMAPFKFIDRIFNDTEIQQYGDGYTSRDYTYISDIVDGVVRSIDRPLGYQVFNLGNGRPFLLKNFIQLVVENVGKEAIIKVLPEQPGDVKHTCACIKKARDLLGYDPQVTFEEGISKTVAWYKDAHASGVFDTDDDISDEDGTTVASVESSMGGIALVSAIKSRDRLSRCVSDLELSSFVQKASEPIERRQVFIVCVCVCLTRLFVPPLEPEHWTPSTFANTSTHHSTTHSRRTTHSTHVMPTLFHSRVYYEVSIR